MKFFLPLILFLIGCGSMREPTLYLFTWNDFIHPEVISLFEKEKKCRVIIDSYDSNESMLAKLMAGGGGYDLIFPTHYFVDLLQKYDLLERLDLDQLKHRDHIDFPLLKRHRFPSTNYAIPYMISTTGIGYRSDRVPPIDSWLIFGSRRYKGRMTLLNDLREVLGVALLTLGYSVNTHSVDEIEEAKELILNWRNNLAKFDSDYKNGIASQEFLICQAYSGEIQQVMEESPEVAYILPKEGGISSCDMVAIPKGGNQLQLAYEFLDFLLRPEIARLNMSYTHGNPVNNKILPEEKTNPFIFLTDEEISKCHPILEIGEAISAYNKAWSQIKD